MDENKKVLLDITLNASDALKQLATTKIRIDELREAQRSLDKTTAEGREEYEAYGAEIKRLNNVAQGYQKEITNTVKHQQAQQGSLEKLKAELALNTAAYDKLSDAERNSIKGSIFQKAIAETTQKLKEEEEALGNNRRSVGDYAKAGISLRTEIRQLTEALTQMKIAGKEGSEEYQAMSLRAAQLNDAMGDVQQQTRGMASDTKGLDIATQSLSGLVGAFGAYQSIIGATIDENSELANVMKNLQVAMAALVSLTAIQNTIQKQSVVYIAAENLLKKIGINQTARATAAEIALNTAKSSGTIATKALAVATWLWNAALASNPVILITVALVALVTGIYFLIKALNASSATTKAAEKANAEYERQVQKTQDTIDAINRKQEVNSKAAELRSRNEILELKKNGVTKEEIAKREAKMVQELRDIEIKASKDKENAKRAELSSADNNIAKQKDLLATHRKGSNAYNEQITKVNDLIRSKNELVGVINNEINTQKELNLKSAEEQQADKDAKNAKYKDAYIKNLDLQQKFEEAQLNTQLRYRNDSTKTDAENNALRFQHEKNFEIQMFDLKQKSEQAKLNAQRKFGDITSKEYSKQIEILQAQQKEFDNTQADKTAEFFNSRKKEIIGMIQKDADAQVKDIKANYSQAMKDIGDDPSLSKDEKAFYRTGLEIEQGKQIRQVREQQAQQINSMLELKYKDDLAEYSDNEREKLHIEMEITKQAIALKKEKDLSTIEDEAKLRAQQLQINQIQLNAELLQTQGNIDAQYQLKKQALDRELEINKDNADRVAEIKAEQADLDKEYTEAKIANIEEWANRGMELLGAFNELANALGQAEVQRAEENNSKQKASLDSRLKSGKISQQQYDKDVAKLDADLDRKKAEIARKQAIREKVMNVFQIGINTALSIMSSAKMGFPAAIPFIAMAAALGAVQTAAVLAMPIPKARKGGRIMGSSHENGGVLIEGEGGEQLINKYAVAAYPELINLINTIGNTGGRVPDGGYSSRAIMRDSANHFSQSKTAENTSAMRNQSGLTSSDIKIDADYIVDKLGEQIRNIKIYTAIDDIRKADRQYSDIEGMAKI